MNISDQLNIHSELINRRLTCQNYYEDIVNRNFLIT
jgi:hypothetical protein